jgi:hypothetical protein
MYTLKHSFHYLSPAVCLHGIFVFVRRKLPPAVFCYQRCVAGRGKWPQDFLCHQRFIFGHDKLPQAMLSSQICRWLRTHCIPQFVFRHNCFFVARRIASSGFSNSSLKNTMQHHYFKQNIMPSSLFQKLQITAWAIMQHALAQV